MWRFVVRVMGGFHNIGRICIVIHDDGILIARDMISVWEWEAK